MARTQDQRRWRSKTDCKRIEVYLPVDRIAALDALAAASGVSRATILDSLVAGATPAAADDEGVAAESKAGMLSANIDALIADAAPVAKEASVPVSPQTIAPTNEAAEPFRGYRFRRPRSADEKRYQWIAEVDDGTRIALGSDPARFHRWRGTILSASLYVRETKGDRRETVVDKLLLGR